MEGVWVFGLSDTLKMLILRLWEVAPFNLNIFLTFQRGKKYLLAVALVMIMKEFTLQISASWKATRWHLSSFLLIYRNDSFNKALVQMKPHRTPQRDPMD